MVQSYINKTLTSEQAKTIDRYINDYNTYKKHPEKVAFGIPRKILKFHVIDFVRTWLLLNGIEVTYESVRSYVMNSPRYMSQYPRIPLENVYVTPGGFDRVSYV